MGNYMVKAAISDAKATAHKSGMAVMASSVRAVNAMTHIATAGCVNVLTKC